MRHSCLLILIFTLACTEDTLKPILESSPSIIAVTVSANDDPITTSSELSCSAELINEDEDTSLSYQWANTDGAILGENETIQLSPETVKPTDELRCSVSVDGDAESNMQSETITVENTAPTISEVLIAPDSATVNSLLECTFSAEDPDQEELSSSYSWTVNGNEVGTENTLQLDADNYFGGEVISCLVTVEDPSGASASNSAELTVETPLIENTPPLIDGLELSPNPAFALDEITCNVLEIEDAEEDEVSISFNWQIDGESVAGDSDKLSGPFMVGAEVSCTATPNDGQVDGESISASVVISNSIPVVNSVSLSAGPVYTNDTVSVNVELSDADAEQSLTVSYRWHVIDVSENNEDTEVQVGPETTLESTWYEQGDQVYVIVTPNDGFVDGEAVQSESLTIANTLPVVDSVSISEGLVYTNGTVSVSAELSDIDVGQTVSANYSWHVIDASEDGEDTEVQVGPEAFLEGELFDQGDQVYVVVTPNDGVDNGTSMQSEMVTISNTLPVVEVIDLSPGPIYTNGTVNVLSYVTDADREQSLSTFYSWHVIDASENGIDIEVQLGPDATLDGMWFDRDDQVYVIVIPNDGLADGRSSRSASLTIANSPPIITSVSLTPESATQGEDDLSCTVIATDADNDDLIYTYEWSNSEGLQSTADAVLLASMIHPAHEVNADTWTCTVSADDGTEVSAGSSATAVAENRCGTLNFMEASDALNIADHPDLDVGTDNSLTAELWVNFNEWDSLSDAVLLSKTSTDLTNASDYKLYIESDDQSLTWLVGDPTVDCASLSVPVSSQLRLNRWQHIAASFDHTSGQIALFIDGQLIDSCTPGSPSSAKAPSNDADLIIGNGVEIGNPAKAMIAAVNLSKSVKYTQQFTPQIELLDAASVAYWKFQQATGAYDVSGNEHDGVILELWWSNFCPEADSDGDGIAVWQDCNDEDENLSVAFAGDSALCAGLSCAQLVEDGFLAEGESGNFWIDPDGTGAFETFCDTTVGDGTWTLVAKVQSGAESQWTYDSPKWTIPGNEFNENDQSLDSGEAKYRAYDTLPFQEIMIQEPVNGNMMVIEASGASMVSFMANQAENTEASVTLAVQNDTSNISYLGFNTSYNICDGHMSTFLSDTQYQVSFNVAGSYEATGNTATGSVRIGYWGSGSNAWNWQWTSDCAIGLGLKTYGYQGTSESGTSFGDLTQIWVR